MSHWAQINENNIVINVTVGNNEVIGYDLVTTPLTNRIWTILDRGQLWSENEEANTRPLLDSTNPAFPAAMPPNRRIAACKAVRDSSSVASRSPDLSRS